MNGLRDALIESFESGTFLEMVYSRSLKERDERNALAAELAALHNEGAIDVIAAFGKLKNSPDSDVGFFLTRHVFENVLPQITAPMKPVLACALQLYQEAGHDMAAGGIFDAFIAFCEKDPSRSQEALKEIEEHLIYIDFLPPTIIAGSRTDSAHYLAHALRLAGSGDIEIRKRAIFSLGKIEWPEGDTPAESTYAALEKVLREENDDELLAGVVKTSFSLLQRDKSQESRITQLIEGALSRGHEYTLHAASSLFGFHTSELPDCLLDTLLSHLLRVNRANKATLDNIDYGVSHLLKRDTTTKAIAFLEEFLLSSADELMLNVFDSVVSQIRDNKTLMSKVGTRWLGSGERVLCQGVNTIVGAGYGANLPLEVDSSELQSIDSKKIIFLARKAIGYLFFNPISTASVIISLMRHTTDADVLKELGNLLFNPLFLNFTGKAREYTAERAVIESGKVKGALDDALKAIDYYLDELRSVGEIPELHPSEAQREAHKRMFSRQMEEAFEVAETQSVLLSLIDKQVLLYGQKSINYVYGSEGQTKRVEIPLRSHATEFEIPRLQQIDPAGLEQMLIIFQMEQMRA